MDQETANIHTTFFSKIYHFFLQMTTFFSKPWICSMEFAGPMDRTPDRTYPILETFLYLITKRRFGGVGAPEGLEIAPDILIQHFSPKSKTDNIFLQIILHFSPKHTKFFSKTYKNFLENPKLSGCEPSTFDACRPLDLASSTFRRPL